jgi:peptidoglycan hydrolase-like protein with peptidoglycan-binding domain
MMVLTCVLTAAGFVLPSSAQTNSADSVKQAQQTLKDKGYYTGNVDGIMGPKTRSALRQYQAKEKLTANGRLTAETAQHLGVGDVTPGQHVEKGASAAKKDYGRGSSDLAQGTKSAGHEMKKGEVGESAVQMGKGVGRGAKSIGKGTAEAAKGAGKGVGKGVKDVFDPNRK